MSNLPKITNDALLALIGEHTDKHFLTDAERAKLAGVAEGATNYVHPATHPATMITEDSTHLFLTDAERTKLAGVATGATNYVHPANHPPTIITQDASNRFVTDTEKTTWNGKASTAVVTTGTDGLMIAADKTKLDGVAVGANNYVHPANHPATVITEDSTHRFTTDAEKTTWNGKASTSVVTTGANGLMIAADKSKLDGVATGANNYVHPANHPPSIITQDTTNRFVTDAEKTTWNGKASTTQVTTSVDGLMIAADKTKLDGVAAGANNYVHPANHPPAIITQDASNRFVTDTEKSTWNGKANPGANNIGVSAIASGTTADCNLATTTGVYHASTATLNRPVANNGALLVYGAADTAGQYCAQMYTLWSGVTYFRAMSAGVWGAWQLSYDSGNHNSTGDPHAQYVKKASDTMTGDLYANSATNWLGRVKFVNDASNNYIESFDAVAGGSTGTKPLIFTGANAGAGTFQFNGDTTFTGNVTAPTATVGTNTTQVATTAFVLANASGGGAVTSVAGRTGVVTLTSADVGLGNVTNESKATMFTSPAFTVTPTAPTPATADNSVNIATTAFVKAQNYLTSAPVTSVATKTGAVTLVAGDVGLGNVTNESKATMFTDAVLTGNPTVLTLPVDDVSARIANAAWVIAQASSTAPVMDGTATVGVSKRWARADHIHPSDTTRVGIKASAKVNLTSISATTIATYTTPSSGASMYQVMCGFGVLTATTSVTITITWTDSAGTGAQTVTLLNAQASNIGTYSLLPVFIGRINNSDAITVTATAGTINNVTVWATITQVG